MRITELENDQRKGARRFDGNSLRLSACLTTVVVSPYAVRAEISVGHYIVVSAPLGGVGGWMWVIFIAFKTWQACGLPEVVPLRT